MMAVPDVVRSAEPHPEPRPKPTSSWTSEAPLRRVTCLAPPRLGPGPAVAWVVWVAADADWRAIPAGHGTFFSAAKKRGGAG